MAKRRLVVALAVVAGCSFSPAGGDQPGGDAHDTDATVAIDAGDSIDAGNDAAVEIDAAPPIDAPPDASTDAMVVCPPDQVVTPIGCQSRPSITCSMETDGNGVNWRKVTVTGWITAGLLGTAPQGASPSYLGYGSDVDSVAVQATCSGADRWVIPYPGGCGAKPFVAWAGLGEPNASIVLRVSLAVEGFNLGVVYDDGTVRWADLAIDDGDLEGFTVGGEGSGYSCRIVRPGGVGGKIRVSPQ